MNGKIAKGPSRTTRRPGAGSRSQARTTTPLRPFCAARRSSTRATHSSVPTLELSAGSGSGAAAGSPPSPGCPPPRELMGHPLAHEPGSGTSGNRDVPPVLWRRGLAGETGFPPRERAEGERRSYLLDHGRAEQARRPDGEQGDQQREAFPVRVRETTSVSAIVNPIDTEIVRIWTLEMKKFWPM